MHDFSAVLHFARCFPKEINDFRTFIPSLDSKSSTKIDINPEWRPKITFCKKNRLDLCEDTMEKMFYHLEGDRRSWRDKWLFFWLIIVHLCNHLLQSGWYRAGNREKITQDASTILQQAVSTKVHKMVPALHSEVSRFSTDLGSQKPTWHS